MNDASETDASLVAGALAGNLDAFAALVHRYRDSYTRFAVRMLGDRADADDVLQSAWMRAFRHLNSCREPERFGGWLYQIVANECRSFVTRRARRGRRVTTDDVELERLTAPAPPDALLRDEIQRAIGM